jgi:hypothetical protein
MHTFLALSIPGFPCHWRVVHHFAAETDATHLELDASGV